MANHVPNPTVLHDGVLYNADGSTIQPGVPWYPYTGGTCPTPEIAALQGTWNDWRGNNWTPPAWVAAPVAPAGAKYPPEMLKAWAAYWAAPFKPRAVPHRIGPGYLLRIGKTAAVYARDGIAPFALSPDTDLNVYANCAPEVGASFEHAFPPYKVVPLA